ncbi:MAG: hypothetical protein ABIF28_08695 [Pseudomonadota bacterium]
MALHPQLDELLDRVLPTVKHFHSKSMLAPHAATIDHVGALTGRALTTDGSNQLTVSQAISHFESSFSELAKAGEIHASGIFYHGAGVDTSSGTVELPPASTVEECVALVGLLEHVSGESIYILIPYQSGPSSIEYSVGKLIEKPPRVFLQKATQRTAKPWWRFW